jgi:hypothetical protein
MEEGQVLGLSQLRELDLFLQEGPLDLFMVGDRKMAFALASQDEVFSVPAPL